MEYKLFDDYITLQSLLKTTGLLHSGGAIKSFLAENQVLVNGQEENRRGKKLRVGDLVELPEQAKTITLAAPSPEEIQEHENDLAEKARVAAIVKEMNKQNKLQKQTKIGKKQARAPRQTKHTSEQTDRRPVRFPGT
ncbi:S4 domain-containing protein YaaA [Streptococcus suis]|uniref:S4 domain-containing protein YaaA n=1 Tax=Streptococcus suivaginalis TaxID=3028082 RepID=A0AA96VF59_9STRE|nr:S4 domain-containing protein YaaA [Streptococcus sp. 29896]MCK4028133.1 S4 domain-containing protein YaaA [Streptococcus suis]WNY47146.1 S4 domain-containing protein YaaA [Streptococcus sp. 29896]